MAHGRGLNTDSRNMELSMHMKNNLTDLEKKYEEANGHPYDNRGMTETCLNCMKESCALAGFGNKAGINENDGCWLG